MRSDDLVPLLKPDPGQVVGYRQGVIVAWNPNTAENLVTVGDSLMENLPILNTSEAAILAPGDVVSILTAGRTWGIMGRYTVPGTPEAVSALSAIRVQADTVPNYETPVSTVVFDDMATPGPQIEISVPASGRVLLLISCDVSATADGTGVPFINRSGAFMGYDMTGANTSPAASNFVARGEVEFIGASGTSSHMTASVSRVVPLTGLTPGDTTFTAKYMIDQDTGSLLQVGSRTLTALAF